MKEDIFDRADRECRQALSDEEAEYLYTVQVEVVNANGERVYALLPSDQTVEQHTSTVDFLANQGGVRSGL